MAHQIIHNDTLKWAANYTGPKFHVLFCDPPYHLKPTHPGESWFRLQALEVK